MKKYGFIVLLAIVGFIWLGRYLYFKPKYVQGETAPDFEMQLLEGKKMNFHDLQGNIVLLDFWGSWCGPCRRENPHLVKLYDEFHDRSFDGAKNFEIVSIALEMKESRWKAAIAKDGLDWPYHHADFNRMQSDIADKYGVKEIPTKFLITPEGFIAGVNPTIEEIKSFLSSRLIK